MSTLTFPTDDSKPIVSMILCTRGRPKLLSDSLMSLINTATHKDRIEFVLRADADDVDTISACYQFLNYWPNSQLWVSPRGKGYLDIHHWTSTLIQLAKADWTFIWNDDAYMTTQGWDDLLLNMQVECWHNVSDIYMLSPVTKGRPGCHEFPILRKKMVQLLGGIGLSPHADNWLNRVLGALQSFTICNNIEVDHISGQLEDDTRKGSVAAYAGVGGVSLAQETLESPWAQAAIRSDIHKLFAYIQAHNQGGRI